MLHSQPFPQPMEPARHEIVHQIVAPRYGIKNARHVSCLLCLRDLLKTKMGAFAHANFSEFFPSGGDASGWRPHCARSVAGGTGFTHPFEIALPERFLVAPDLI